MATKRFVLGVVVSTSVLAFIAGCGGGGGDPVSSNPPVVENPPPEQPKTIKVNSVSIGGVTIGDNANTADPVPVDADVVVAYDAGGVTAAGTLSVTCTAQGVGVVKSATANTITFGHDKWSEGADCTASVTLTATGYTSATKNVTFKTKVAVIVPPPVAKLEYTDVVVAIWPQFPDWPGDMSGIVRIDRNSPKGYLPNKNSTGKQFYFTGIRPTPRADCLIELSSLDSAGAEIKVLYNLKTGEQTLDTSTGGAAWNRFTDYRYSYVWDPAYPLLAGRAQVADGAYEVLDTEPENMYFRDNSGVVTTVIKSTFAATGSINGIWTYSCKAQ